jgi:hypothetical protein
MSFPSPVKRRAGWYIQAAKCSLPPYACPALCPSKAHTRLNRFRRLILSPGNRFDLDQGQVPHAALNATVVGTVKPASFRSFLLQAIVAECIRSVQPIRLLETQTQPCKRRNSLRPLESELVRIP